MFYSSGYALLHLTSVIMSVAMSIAAWRKPLGGRVIFFVLFTWASATNFTFLLSAPEVYREYADLAVLPLYSDMIRLLTDADLAAIVAVIATSQALMALGLFVGGPSARGAIGGAIVFLLAIAPLGVGSGFPSTLLMALGLLFVLCHPKSLEETLFRRIQQVWLERPIWR